MTFQKMPKDSSRGEETEKKRREIANDNVLQKQY